ncbi:MAG: hypothetical protein M1832_002621 [Thelocarpon impressellum]|nr:MAG: hypothetical protein M1832_002621 [Thelocarpon impressellum]
MSPPVPPQAPRPPPTDPPALGEESYPMAYEAIGSVPYHNPWPVEPWPLQSHDQHSTSFFAPMGPPMAAAPHGYRPAGGQGFPGPLQVGRPVASTLTASPHLETQAAANQPYNGPAWPTSFAATEMLSPARPAAAQGFPIPVHAGESVASPRTLHTPSQSFDLLFSAPDYRGGEGQSWWAGPVPRNVSLAQTVPYTHTQPVRDTSQSMIGVAISNDYTGTLAQIPATQSQGLVETVTVGDYMGASGEQPLGQINTASASDHRGTLAPFTQSQGPMDTSDMGGVGGTVAPSLISRSQMPVHTANSGDYSGTVAPSLITQSQSPLDTTNVGDYTGSIAQTLNTEGLQIAMDGRPAIKEEVDVKDNAKRSHASAPNKGYLQGDSEQGCGCHSPSSMCPSALCPPPETGEQVPLPPLPSSRPFSTPATPGRPTGRVQRASGSGAGRVHSRASSQTSFVNFTSSDHNKIVHGVAPSGSSKTKARREKEVRQLQKQLEEVEREKRRHLDSVARQVIEAAGGDPEALDKKLDEDKAKEKAKAKDMDKDENMDKDKDENTDEDKHENMSEDKHEKTDQGKGRNTDEDTDVNMDEDKDGSKDEVEIER